MCGIAGLWAPELSSGEVGARLDAMTEALHRRGPDDRGALTWDHGFALGMTRLAIIDVAGGHQPIDNEDGSLTIVCNGEIYNHGALREDLRRRGHRFKTDSDVEVILHLYEDEGDQCLAKVHGMFAVAILDRRNRRLFVGRDRLGIKPLYYAFSPATRRFVFGSEIKALVGSGLVDRRLDPQGFDQYLTFGYVPSPYSIYSAIRKLPPAHYLVLQDDGVRLQQYWAPAQAEARGSLDELEQQFDERFAEAVRSHLMSEVPLGAFLSGGVDSGLVVSAMAEATSSPVRTFTIGFGGATGGFLDERSIAREISARYGTAHTELEVTPSAADVLDEVVHAFDEPFADDSVIPSYYVCKLARQHVTVALSGLGGDELFGGYERHLGFALSSTYARVPGVLRNGLIAPLVNALPERADGHYTVNHLKRFVRASHLPPEQRYASYVSVLNQGLKAEVLSDDAQAWLAASRRSAPEIATMNPALSGLPAALDYDLRTYLPDDVLALSDRLSMWSGLELRVPFLDDRLVEFCYSLPPGVKIRGMTKKFLLRRVAERRLPRSVLTHRKQGFASPMAAWLRTDLRDYVRDALAPARLARHGLFRPEAVARMLDDHQSRRESYDKQLFTLLMFQKWHDHFPTVT